MKTVLVTTTSFQDTPGSHQELLTSQDWEVSYARGPLSECQILELVGAFDGIICGDDVFSRAVLEKAKPRLQYLSKYGIGVDKIDIEAATDLGVPVLFTPGVNHTTVAEHTIMLFLMLMKKAVFHVNKVHEGSWIRQTGNEIFGKTIGILGMGRIGKEVATRANAFGLKVIGYDVYWDDDFAKTHGIIRANSYEEVWRNADLISLHTNLNSQTHHLIRRETIAQMKDGVHIVNCARGEIVKTEDICEALGNGKVAGCYIPVK